MAMSSLDWDHILDGDIQWYRKHSPQPSPKGAQAAQDKRDYERAVQILENKRRDDERIAKSNICDHKFFSF